MPGYSGTPLAGKLGIKEGTSVHPIGAPVNYESMLEPLPSGVRFVARIAKTVDVVHLFTSQRAELTRRLASLRTAMRPDAAVWVSWPKQASKVPTNITEDVIREVALPIGFVDVKVCAVDATWSGLKLVIRKELR